MGITIRDIAALCGVNSSTVSRALRDDPRVKPATRDAIMALACEHGYTPNISARNLAAGKTNTIWFFLGSLKNEIEQKPVVMLSSLIQENGYDLMLVLHRGEKAHFLRLLRKLTQKITDAAIILPAHLDDETEIGNILSTVDIPVVFIDRWFPSLNCPVVTTDNEFSARTLAEKCLASGAEIFYVFFPEGNSVSQARKRAACDFLQSRGMKYYDETNFDAEVLRRHPDKPLAVLGSTGRLLSTTFEARFGDMIGNRAVYGGFFDSWQGSSKEFYRRIFICCQDFDEIARQASELVISMLNGQNPPPKTIIKVPPEKFIEI